MRSGWSSSRGRVIRGSSASSDLETYLSQEHILVSSRRRGFSVEDYELSRHGLKRRIRLRCQHYFAACRVVSETDLILTMAERYARIVNRLFRNRMLPFPLKAPDYDAYLYWHANAEADPANHWLRNRLMEAFGRGRHEEMNAFSASTGRATV